MCLKKFHFKKNSINIGGYLVKWVKRAKMNNALKTKQKIIFFPISRILLLWTLQPSAERRSWTAEALDASSASRSLGIHHKSSEPQRYLRAT